MVLLFSLHAYRIIFNQSIPGMILYPLLPVLVVGDHYAEGPEKHPEVHNTKSVHTEAHPTMPGYSSSDEPDWNIPPVGHGHGATSYPAGTKLHVRLYRGRNDTVN